ncbi:SCAN domain-containing protein 1 [Nannospalax galili]|uniref:SCAN domain-containing protein 1 n=1 Tax=Nannospalax galili TaxID=1026970 RepID=UPI0004ED2DDD|nr:SCAN domain-containing protein 1 [Nannospalax galili]
MAASQPSLAAQSPAVPLQQQEGAGGSGEPEPQPSSPLDPVPALPTSPELPGALAALGSAPEAEATPRPGGARPGPETFRQRFRQFRYQDAAGPREAFRQLRELSRQWLRPDIRTKEQIVEMLVQEQLLAILPDASRARRLRRRADVRITG